MHVFYLGLLFALLAGCFNPAMMVDGRTALEQELTRAAIFRAVKQLPIHKNVLQGRWKIAVVSPDSDDDSWTRTLLRQHLALQGANIVTNTTENLPVVEAVVQFAGSDIDNFIVGIPIPGSMGNSSFGFYHDSSEKGRAHIQLNFWTSDGKLLAHTPAALGEAHYSEITVLTFIGPFSFTDLRDVKIYGRFSRLGIDEWESVRGAFTQSDAETSGVWIMPEDSSKQ